MQKLDELLLQPFFTRPLMGRPYGFDDTTRQKKTHLSLNFPMFITGSPRREACKDDAAGELGGVILKRNEDVEEACKRTWLDDAWGLSRRENSRIQETAYRSTKDLRSIMAEGGFTLGREDIFMALDHTTTTTSNIITDEPPPTFYVAFLYPW
jgi:hypothetical protein